MTTDGIRQQVNGGEWIGSWWKWRGVPFWRFVLIVVMGWSDGEA